MQSTKDNGANDMSKADVVTEMEMAVETIREAVDALKQAGKQAVMEGMIGETELYRLEAGAISHIEMALGKEHEWASSNMFTVEDTIEEIKQLGDEGDECPECGDELVASGRNGGGAECPAGC